MARTLRLFAPRRRGLGPLPVVVLALLIVVPLLVCAGWITGEIVLRATSGVEHCTSCHSMQPMGESYREDVHGGRSPSGVVADCADCHFPGDTATGFLWARAMLASRELWSELAGDPAAIDWQARRLDRERFVFDSSCLACHGSLSRPYPRAEEMREAHDAYFAGEIEARCVTCHASAGHRDLDAHLP